jgi:hypothetical protein
MAHFPQRPSVANQTFPAPPARFPDSTKTTVYPSAFIDAR